MMLAAKALISTTSAYIYVFPILLGPATGVNVTHLHRRFSKLYSQLSKVVTMRPRATPPQTVNLHLLPQAAPKRVHHFRSHSRVP